jgi:hypothetical protein
MQIILSDSLSNNDKNLVNNSVLAIFKSKNIDKASFQPEKTVFISNNTEDKSDFYFDIAAFVNDNRSHKMIVLKNLANVIFGEYVDPRDIIGNYEIISSGATPAIPVPTPTPEAPVVKEIEKLEQELETIKKEVVSEKQAAAPIVTPAQLKTYTVNSGVSGSILG